MNAFQLQHWKTFFINYSRAVNQRLVWGLVQRHYICILMKKLVPHFLVIQKNEVCQSYPTMG